MPKPRLLVVDDEPMVLTTYREILEHAGYSVTCVNSASAAYQEIADCEFDLLMSDLSLENKNDGVRVIEAMHRKNPAAVTILFTGYLAEDIAEMVMPFGTMTVSKPVDVPMLLQTIDRLLRQHHSPDAAD